MSRNPPPPSGKKKSSSKKTGSTPTRRAARSDSHGQSGAIDYRIDNEGERNLRGRKVPAYHEPEEPHTKAEAAKNDRISVPAGQANSGTVRAAKLLLALGPDRAAEVLQQLKEEEVVRVVGEMVRIKQLSAEERNAILADFQRSFGHVEPPTRGGIELTREILARSLGEARADELLQRVQGSDIKRDFQFIEQMDPVTVSSVLAQEHPQVAAAALSVIQPRSAAAILKHMPDPFRSEVALRIARTTRTYPEALSKMAKILHDKLLKRRDEVYSETGGAETLAGILNHMDRGTEEGILHALEGEAPEIYDEVREMLFTFEELVNLSVREMRILIARINDDELLASALRGAPEDLRRTFFNGVSQNRAADIMEMMQRRGPISLREINEARSVIVQIARRIEEEGELVIKKEKEEYI